MPLLILEGLELLASIVLTTIVVDRGYSLSFPVILNSACMQQNKKIFVMSVYQMYAENNVTSCICHKLGICTLTNPSVGDVIYQPIQVWVM